VDVRMPTTPTATALCKFAATTVEASFCDLDAELIIYYIASVCG
jgi:hypothetical protein